MHANAECAAVQCFLVWILGDGGTVRSDRFVELYSGEKHTL
jgi:hypothetical protein